HSSSFAGSLIVPQPSSSESAWNTGLSDNEIGFLPGKVFECERLGRKRTPHGACPAGEPFKTCKSREPWFCFWHAGCIFVDDGGVRAHVHDIFRLQVCVSDFAQKAWFSGRGRPGAGAWHRREYSHVQCGECCVAAPASLPRSGPTSPRVARAAGEELPRDDPVRRVGGELPGLERTQPCFWEPR